MTCSPRRALSFFVFSVALLVPLAASAQPYNAWFTVSTGHGYVAIPANPAFDFSTGFTFEAWVAVSDSGACSSITGKGWTASWWVGVCGTTLRSYIKGTSSLLDGGTIPANTWTHIAVTYDGTVRKHYIDGEEVASRVESGPMPTTANEVRIGSDVSYQFTAKGAIDEVRYWNVARTKDQIRSAITTTLSSGTGLVAAYHLDGGAVDSAGGHNGTTNGTAGYLNAPIGGLCSTNATTLCFDSGKFGVTVKWIASDASSGDGKTVPGASANSGLFWFFAPDNWELLIKQINGCGLNSRRWIFSAATTNVHYNVTVTNFINGDQKHYFNFSGISAPAVNDVSAFATCP